MGRKERRRGPTALALLRRSTRHLVKGTALRAMMRLPCYLRYLTGDSPKLRLYEVVYWPHERDDLSSPSAFVGLPACRTKLRPKDTSTQDKRPYTNATLQYPSTAISGDKIARESLIRTPPL